MAVRADTVRRQAAGAGTATADAATPGHVGDGCHRQRRRGESARVTGRRGVAPRHAGARRVSDAGIAHRVVEQAASAAGSAAGTTDHGTQTILAQESFQLAVLLGESLFVLRDVAVDLFQAKNFVLESLDVELFALSMCSARAGCQ